MPKITPVLPSKNKEAMEAQLTKVLTAAKTLGATLDAQGFVQSWLSDNTRVVVAYEDETPVGFAILVFGRRWFDEHFTASVLMAIGPARPAVLEFLVEMARVLGAAKLFYEAQEGDTIGGTTADMRALELD